MVTVDEANAISEYDKENNTDSVTIEGHLPEVMPSPSALDFGSVKLGSSSDAVVVTIQNTGTADLIVGTITVTGMNTQNFAVGNDHCSGATLSIGSSCTLEATFTPSAIGNRSASLSVPSNAGPKPTLIAMKGTGAQK